MYVIEPLRDGEEVLDLGLQLALQVFALHELELDDSAVFPYRPAPSIQIGKYQNALKEVNQEYVQANRIPVIRRETGGGAIYMDRNQANFVFIMKDSSNNLQANFKQIYEPAIRALKKMGAKAVQMSGRNDLEIQGQKVSGAALTIVNGKLYGGYSLLLDSNAEEMVKCLTPDKKKLTSKGIGSVKKRVANIRDYLSEAYQDITVEEFKDKVLEEITGQPIDSVKRYYLSKDQWNRVDQIAAAKYNNWEWNYGSSPSYELTNEKRFSSGTLQVTYSAKKGKITAIKFYGDFFGDQPIHELEEKLLGCSLKEDHLRNTIAAIDVNSYISNLKAEELVHLILH